MRTGILAAGLLLLTLAGCTSLPSGTACSPSVAPADLVGTWKLESARYDGREWPGLHQWRVVKMVTPERFLWFRSDRFTGIAQTLAYGLWTLEDNVYTEVPTDGNGADFGLIRDQNQVFRCAMSEGKWHHTGTLSDGTSIDEVWVRVSNP